MSAKKKPRSLSTFNRQCLAIIDRYIDETGDKNPDMHDVAAWGHAKGLIDPPQINPIKLIARMLSRAARQDFITDGNGEPVRRRHAYKETRGDQQMMFWFKMEDATPEKMKLSAAGRRNGTLADIFQLDRDVRYYNDKHNPGDPIELDFNFNPDVAERHLSTEYGDAPPDDAPSDGGDQPPAAPV